MQLQTILNRVHKVKGFVYEQARFDDDRNTIEVALRARKGSRGVCGGCRTLETAEIALYHALGRLPEPKLTHEFC